MNYWVKRIRNPPSTLNSAYEWPDSFLVNNLGERPRSSVPIPIQVSSASGMQAAILETTYSNQRIPYPYIYSLDKPC